MDEHCLLPRSEAVRQMANLVLQKWCQNQGNPRTVGQQWVHTFVRRHEALNRDIIRYNYKYDFYRIYQLYKPPPRMWQMQDKCPLLGRGKCVRVNARNYLTFSLWYS